MKRNGTQRILFLIHANFSTHAKFLRTHASHVKISIHAKFLWTHATHAKISTHTGFSDPPKIFLNLRQPGYSRHFF